MAARELRRRLAFAGIEMQRFDRASGWLVGPTRIIFLEVLSCDSGQRTAHPEARVDVTGASRLGVAVVFDGPVLRFACRMADAWRTLPVELNATILSDEHAARIVRGEPEAWGFTGAFAGLWVQDLGADGIHAEFGDIRYSED